MGIWGEKMKTRIISAVVGIALFFLVIYASLYISPIMLIALALLNVIAIYEVLRNTGMCKSAKLIFSALVSGAVLPFIFSYFGIFTSFVCVCFYILAIIILSIFYHNEVNMESLFSAISAPVMLSVAFSSIFMLFMAKDVKLLYFILIFAFSWGADTGAYFGGTFFGKHKLAPVISPKKTVEGMAFGILGSLIVTVTILIIYSSSLKVDTNWFLITLCAIIFSIVGMIGDLFASLIKRSCGIKDYGNLMPGHGGVLDRFDSVLLIAPFFYLVLRIFKVA